MPKFSIRQSAWDNWYGYEGKRRVQLFTNSRPGHGAQEIAEQWLAKQEQQQAVEAAREELENCNAQDYDARLQNLKVQEAKLERLKNA